MNDKQSRRRWEEKKHEMVSDQEILKVLKMGIDPGRIKGLNTYSIHGVEYFDLSGMTIEDEVLDVGYLAHIDLSYSRLKNVKFTSNTTLFNFRFESAELIDVSFKPSIQNIGGNLILENFVFKGAKIEKSDFSLNDFTGRNDFSNSKFRDVDFSNTNFEKSIFCDFSKSKFYGCSLSKSIFEGTILGKCLFSDCDLRDTGFEKTNLSDIAFKNCIVNSRTTFDEKIILEKNESFENAYESYIQLKNLFRNTGHFHESQRYYLREVYTRGKKEKNGIKKIFLMALGSGAQICHKPWHIFVWSLFFVLFFAGAYLCTGIGTEKAFEKDFFKCLYFSVVTFTTLGYGDLTPISGFSKLLAGIQAFLGPAFLSLFMASLIKKTIQE